MAKKKAGGRIFRCSSCGYSQPKWLGRCPGCGEWNTFEEQFQEADFTPGFASSAVSVRQTDEAHPVPLEQVEVHDTARITTGISEFDRVLGGGAVKRSAVLIGGEPGIGKSTLLMQAAAAAGQRTLYVSGEESAGQIRGRADRLGVPLKNIELLCANSVENIEKVLNNLNPLIVIIDSVQTLFSPQAGTIPGTINQLKYCANELVQWVKERDAALFLTAHVTKEGVIAGRIGTHGMHDVTEGGVLGAVWEMCNISGLGVLIDEDKIAVSEVTKKVCKYFSIDWKRLISSGCMLIVASAEKAEYICAEFENNGIMVSQIGTVTEASEGLMLKKSDGKLEKIDSPKTDELYRVSV